MRLAIITDAHANLPALEAALAQIRRLGYDLLIHTGDAIGIGPFPTETLDLLLATPNTRLIMGNHDAWFAHGWPASDLTQVSAEEIEHQVWASAQLDPALRPVVAAWPWALSGEFEDVPITWLHYPRGTDGDFVPIVPQPSIADLDSLFAAHNTPLVFYGHHNLSPTIRVRRAISTPARWAATPSQRPALAW